MRPNLSAETIVALATMNPHDRAAARGEILVRAVADSVIATSAIEGIVLDRQGVLKAVFDALVELGEI